MFRYSRAAGSRPCSTSSSVVFVTRQPRRSSPGGGGGRRGGPPGTTWGRTGITGAAKEGPATAPARVGGSLVAHEWRHTERGPPPRGGGRARGTVHAPPVLRRHHRIHH